MSERREFPLAGILLALATAAILLAAGMDPILVLGAVTVWIASFWLVLPAPVPPSAPVEPEAVRLTRTGMADLIEHSALPSLLLDGERIIVANAAAREVIGRHVLGQDARVALRHPGAVDLLARPDRGSATIPALTGPRSVWQMTVLPISERYRLVELVDRAAEADISRAHTDFVANASHELRTPLASIIGYMETLVEAPEAVDPKRTAHFHGTVLREARRLQRLVNDLMSLSRIEAERHDHPRERIDIARLVRKEAVDDAGPERQGRLEFAEASEPLIVRGDRRQLEQLVSNLVDNAFKYGAPDGTVTVGVAADERDMAVLTVTDQGEGIPAEHIPHLTRRFYRTDPGRSRAAGGTGLGLAIVKHIVERHRGRLDIDSHKGKGTTVTVRIPLAPADAAAPPAPDAEPVP